MCKGYFNTMDVFRRQRHTIQEVERSPKQADNWSYDGAGRAAAVVSQACTLQHYRARKLKTLLVYFSIHFTFLRYRYAVDAHDKFVRLKTIKTHIRGGLRVVFTPPARRGRRRPPARAIRWAVDLFSFRNRRPPTVRPEAEASSATPCARNASSQSYDSD
ncbi:hypothetical protein EVAR_49298_1 [Eumeta japonica]|uniref:Uncharacterized protein n=1 Tax=Eumeta variegata TaxID=151549 RepID=A0A4C1XQQ1_EUMVA|nr:hypothetical protein EVAR_49298_1 [Eumeta japonica]